MPYASAEVEDLTPSRSKEQVQLLKRNFAGCCTNATHGYIIGGKTNGTCHESSFAKFDALQQQGRYLNDVIEINLATLAERPLQLHPSSPLPSPRYGHTYAFHEKPVSQILNAFLEIDPVSWRMGTGCSCSVATMWTLRQVQSCGN